MKNKLKVNSLCDLSKKNAKSKSKTVFDFVNQFGTYNIQKTADTENEFPEISQGLPKDEK